MPSQMVEDKLKNITVRMPEELHRPARMKIAELDLSFQEVLLGLLEDWLAGRPASLQAPGAPIAAQVSSGAIVRCPPEHVKLVQAIADAIAHPKNEKEEALEWILQSLLVKTGRIKK
jgi:hypothetical protein